MAIKALKGTKDIYGSEMNAWLEMEDIIRDLCKDFGVQQIRTPIFEQTNLFQRGVGETTDIVQKEMYSFEDKGKNHITLKPEGTAGVVRAFIERKMYADPQPTKLYYITPTFRYERPQAGRQRQFHQFGVEMFGASDATADAEVIALASTLLDRLGIKKVELHINSLGGKECRANYNTKLKTFLANNYEKLCPLCQERYEKNPLRVLDCKNPECQKIVEGAPTVIDCLGPECIMHFEMLQTLLQQKGIPYVVDTGIVRGLDYYTRTVFEFISNDIGSQGAVCGGGRYDHLVEECGGASTPAIGFAAGMERLLMVKQAECGEYVDKSSRDIYIGSIGDMAKIKAHGIAHELCKAGISAEADHLGKSVKAQMKYANKIGAKYSVVLGDDEIQSKKAILRNMNIKEQEEVSIDNLVEILKEKLK